MLVWPALLNGYPIVFSDTGGLLSQALEPDIGWDKPWVYGPFLLLLSGRTTLWLAAAGQGLLLSHMLWLTACVLGRAGAARHLFVCAVLAAGSAAPWFAALLMPDIFAPITVLCVFVLGFGLGRVRRVELGWVAVVATLAIAVHLSHLILAVACLVMVSLLRWRVLWRPWGPLVAALGLLLLSNAAGNGVLGISPYGSLFALARLMADGPARELVEARCPTAGWWLCAWKGRLPTDSDAFLWDPDGPVWANQNGPTLVAAQASQIVRATVLAYPVEVARAAAWNTWRQLSRVEVGDTLGPDYLDVTVWPRIRTYFPPEEQARYQAARQPRGTLTAWAAPLAPWQAGVLIVGAAATLLLGLGGWWRDWQLAAFSVLIVMALLANAFATGALSGPHDRYQARIAWLVLLPLLLLRRTAR